MSQSTEDLLYASVEDVLDRKGVLNTIRAQLRAAVFEAIIDAEDGKSNSETETVREKIKNLPQGQLGLELVTDFLVVCGLRRSLCVLVPEAGLNESEVDRRKLRLKLGLPEKSSDIQIEPILCEFLSNSQGINSVASSLKHEAHQQPIPGSKTGEEDSGYDDEDFEEEDERQQTSIPSPQFEEGEMISEIEDEFPDKDSLNEPIDLSQQPSPHAEKSKSVALEDSDSFLFDDDDVLAEQSSSLNDRLEFSATATNVDGTHVLDEQYDFIESVESIH